MTCTDTDGTVIYHAPTWTLEPLQRGPLFAPVVLWLEGESNVPVLPLRFTAAAFPIVWETADGGPLLGGTIESLSGRPLGYGPAATSTAPMVTCDYELIGNTYFGTFVVTKGLQQMLDLPSSVLGRTIRVDGEGTVQFVVPRTQFPLTATAVANSLPTPDYLRYGRHPQPTTTCRSGGTVLYQGSAYSLNPLIRGYQWSPMAFWLSGDRIVSPRWFTSHVTGSWQTVSGSPARSGTLDVFSALPPSGNGPMPSGATTGVDCSWGGPHDKTVKVSPELAAQLGLPATVVGRSVRLQGTYSVHAYTSNRLFPPA